MKHSRLALLAVPLLLTACASVPDEPNEPRVLVVPGDHKSPRAFRADEARCRAEADDAVAGRTPGEAANDSMARSAVAGTAIGAGAGALIGSTQGQVGNGALIGAASGLALGTLMGSDASARSGAAVQRRFDAVYAQCMVAAGNKVEQRTRRVVVYEDPAVPLYRTAPPPPPVVVYGGPYYYRYRSW